MATPDKNNKMPSKAKHTLATKAGVFALACLVTAPAAALQALNNDQLAHISGQDGVNITLNTSNLSTEALGLRMNTTDANLRGGLEIQNISYTPVDYYGNDMTGTYTGQLTVGIDLGQNAAGTPGGVLSLDMPNRVRFHSDNIKLFDNSGNANEPSTATAGLGELAYDASGKLVLSNVGGLFNADGEDFMLYGKLENANMFWRQQSGDARAPYLVMTDGETFWHAYAAHVGVNKEGLVQRAQLIDLGLEYTTRFKQPDPTTATTATRMSLCTQGTSCDSVSGATDPGIGMFRFGWGGTIVNPYLTFAGGGIVQDSSGNYTKEGIHLVAKWNFLSNTGESSDNFGGGYAPGVTAANFDPTGNDYDSKHTGFHWFLGNESEPDDPAVAGSPAAPVSIEIANWRNLPGAAYGSVMDARTSVVHNGQGGAHALCFGSRACVNADGTHNTGAFGDYLNIAPTATGLGLTVRDSSIRAYSESIRARDDHFPVTVGTATLPGAQGTYGQKDFDWGLINSFSHLDANIYLYPKTSTVLKRSDGSNGNEIVGDILVMGQTLDDNNGSLRNSRTTGCAAATPCLTDARNDYFGNRASNFGNGSHMLIADTKAGNGIGMMDMSFLLMARQTHIIMKPMSSSTATGATGQYDPANYVGSKTATADQAYTGGLDFTSPETRYTLYATFGGIDLPIAGTNIGPGQTQPYTYYPAFGEACPSGQVCPAQLVGGINSWNYEGFFNFRLSPHPASLSGQPNKQYLGYSLAYRATSFNVPGLTTTNTNDPAYGLIGTPTAGRCASDGICSGKGTYFGTAEPSQQDALVTTGGVTGDMAFVNGKMQVTAGKEVLTGGVIDYSQSEMPGLTFSHDILIGMSAYNQIKSRAEIVGGIGSLPGGDKPIPFVINRMEFNGENLGAVAVPKGRYYGVATLKPQRL